MRLRGRFRGKIRKRKLNDIERLELNRYGQMYHNLEERIRDDLMARTHTELERLQEAVKKINKKNCWYAIFRVKDTLHKTITEVMRKKGLK